MKLFARFYRLVWGTDVDPALRPVLAVQFAGSLAGSVAWIFMGIWAKVHLGASDRQLAVTFLVGALLAGLSSYAGGHVSDHVGRRPMILFGWGVQTAMLVGFLAVGDHLFAGLALAAVAPALGSIGRAADTALVADLVPPEKHEAGYASVRIAANLGVVFGPPIGGFLLIGNHWPAFFLGAALFSLSAAAIAWHYLPRTGAYAPESPPDRGSWGVIRRDGAFLVFMASSVLASMTYVAYEVLMPISLTSSHGLQPAAWGFLVIANPILVTAFQLRLIRWTAGIPSTVKLAVAMPLMGLPLLLLNVSAAIPVLLFVIVVFVIGEMLWIPTSQSAVAAFSPKDLRGAYMGFFGSSWSVAWALTPFLGLQIRAAWGDAAMWKSAAAISVLAGVAGALAVRGRREPERDPVASPAT
ncbi:MAG: MFS transporter [Thermoleophilia bacterium]